jgi:hypothetical protein
MLLMQLLVAALLVVTGMSSGLAHLLYIWSQGDTKFALIDVTVDGGTTDQLTRIFTAGHAGTDADYADIESVTRTAVPSQAEQGPGYGANGSAGVAVAPTSSDEDFPFIEVGDCASYQLVTGANRKDCEGRSYGRVVGNLSGDDPGYLAAGEEVAVTLAGGTSRELTMPKSSIDSDDISGGPMVFIPLEGNEWVFGAENVAIHVRLPIAGTAYDEFANAVMAADPTAEMSTSYVGGSDLSDVEIHRNEESVLRLLTVLGCGLGILGLCLAAFGASQDQLRSRTALLLSGVTVRQLRRAGVVEKGFSTAVCGVYFALVAGAFSELLLFLGGSGEKWYWPVWAVIGCAAVACVAAVAGVGAMSVGRLRLGVPDSRE